MKRAAPKIAHSQSDTRVSHSDQSAMTAALDRLYGAALSQVSDIVANLGEGERAKLAVFCYGRAHLNTIGLAIAATCDLDHLIVASSSATAGHTLFTQSRDATMPVERTSPGRRAPITLATAARFASLTFAADEPAELTA